MRRRDVRSFPALCLTLLTACGGGAPAPRRWLALDGAEPALIVLDGGLVPVARVPLRAGPGERLVRFAGDGPHVLRCDARGAWRRAQVRPDGTLEVGQALDDVWDAVPFGRGAVVLLERGVRGSRLRRIGPGTRDEIWVGGTSLRVLARRGDEVLAGGPDGGIVLFAPDGAVRGLGRLSGAIVALAGTREGWVALLGPPAARLVRLDEELGPGLEWTLAAPTTGLAVHPEAGAIWTWGARGASVHDAHGRLLGRFETEMGEPVRRGVALADGGALLACPGALVELGPDARVRRTQGGFGDLVDLRLE